jgi:hypothetical protein
MTAAPLPRLVKKAEACECLAIDPVTFWRRWDAVFTDRRPADRRGMKGRGRPADERLVFADELAAAVEAGGGDRGRAAVLAVRAKKGRD